MPKILTTRDRDDSQGIDGTDSRYRFGFERQAMYIPMVAIVINAAVWLAQWKYLSGKNAAIEAAHLRVLEELEGLRIYLYEIDPQFDEERSLRAKIADGVALQEIHAELRLLDQRRGAGARTLATSFSGRISTSR